MASYQKAVSASFESAAGRIGESIDLLADAGEPLDPWQSDMLARDLAYLQMGNFALATDAAFRVCRPQLYRTSAALIALSGGPAVTVAEMRRELDRVFPGRDPCRGRSDTHTASRREQSRGAPWHAVLLVACEERA